MPVGDDQAPHVEITREVARRFNHLYGREPDFDELRRGGAQEARQGRARRTSRRRARPSARAATRRRCERGRAIIAASASLGASDRERLEGHLRGTGKTILVEPDVLLTETSKLRRPRRHEDEQELRQRDRDARGAGRGRRARSAACRPIRRACAAPTRAIPRSARCGSSTRSTRTTRPRPGSSHGCTTAAIGCLDCKQPVIEAIIARAGAVARARRAVPRRTRSGALDRRGRHRAGAHGRARDDARRARRDGARLLATARVARRRALRASRRRSAARRASAFAAPRRRAGAGLAGRAGSRCRRTGA